MTEQDEKPQQPTDQLQGQPNDQQISQQQGQPNDQRISQPNDQQISQQQGQPNDQQQQGQPNDQRIGQPDPAQQAGGLGPSLLDRALPPVNSLVSADKIIGPAELRQRFTRLSESARQADLCRLTAAQSAQLRGPATPQQIDLYAACAQMASANPAALTMLGIDPRMMPMLFSLDLALARGENATAQAVRIFRKGVTVLAADQTGTCDALAEAALHIAQDPTLTEAERLDAWSWMQPVNAARKLPQDQMAARAARARRALLLHQQLAQSPTHHPPPDPDPPTPPGEARRTTSR